MTLVTLCFFPALFSSANNEIHFVRLCLFCCCIHWTWASVAPRVRLSLCPVRFCRRHWPLGSCPLPCKCPAPASSSATALFNPFFTRGAHQISAALPYSWWNGAGVQIRWLSVGKSRNTGFATGGGRGVHFRPCATQPRRLRRLDPPGWRERSRRVGRWQPPAFGAF